MVEDLWYTRIPPTHRKYIIENKLTYVKIVIMLLIINPALFAYSIVKLNLKPDWLIFPTDEIRWHVVFTTLYILFMLGCCGVMWAHLLVCVYLCIYVKMEMELLTLYFKDVSSKLCSSAFSKNADDNLIEAIKIHIKLARYVILILLFNNNTSSKQIFL